MIIKEPDMKNPLRNITKRYPSIAASLTPKDRHPIVTNPRTGKTIAIVDKVTDLS